MYMSIIGVFCFEESQELNILTVTGLAKDPILQQSLQGRGRARGGEASPGRDGLTLDPRSSHAAQILQPHITHPASVLLLFSATEIRLLQDLPGSALYENHWCGPLSVLHTEFNPNIPLPESLS